MGAGPLAAASSLGRSRDGLHPRSGLLRGLRCGGRLEKARDWLLDAGAGAGAGAAPGGRRVTPARVAI